MNERITGGNNERKYSLRGVASGAGRLVGRFALEVLGAFLTIGTARNQFTSSIGCRNLGIDPVYLTPPRDYDERQETYHENEERN